MVLLAYRQRSTCSSLKSSINVQSIGENARQRKVRVEWYNVGRTIRQRAKMNNYTAVLKQEDDAWVGWIEEVPGVNCQESTRDELIETLKITLQEALEMNRMDARGAVDGDFEELKIAI